MKFKEVSSALCNKYMSLKIRGASYKNYVRNALTYGALRIEDERRLITAEMRMLRLICGKTLKDKITNEKVRERTDVDEIKDSSEGKGCVGLDIWREWMRTEDQQRPCIFK